MDKRIKMHAEWYAKQADISGFGHVLVLTEPSIALIKISEKAFF
jgi:hypothetical protein